MGTLQVGSRAQAVKAKSDRQRLIECGRRGGMSDAAIARALKVGDSSLGPRPLNGHKPIAIILDEVGSFVETAWAMRPRETLGLSMDGITRAFLEEMNAAGWPITEEDLKADSTARVVSGPRMVAMWLIRNLMGTEASFPNIVKHFGKTDHTTAIHAINRHGAEKAMRRERTLAQVADRVRARFFGELIK